MPRSREDRAFPMISGGCVLLIAGLTLGLHGLHRGEVARTTPRVYQLDATSIGVHRLALHPLPGVPGYSIRLVHATNPDSPLSWKPSELDAARWTLWAGDTRRDLHIPSAGFHAEQNYIFDVWDARRPDVIHLEYTVTETTQARMADAALKLSCPVAYMNDLAAGAVIAQFIRYVVIGLGGVGLIVLAIFLFRVTEFLGVLRERRHDS